MTPRVEQSWLVFKQGCADLAARLERMFGWLRVDKRYRARELISELKELEKRFASWPELEAETVALERKQLTRRLGYINREVEDLVRHLAK